MQSFAFFVQNQPNKLSPEQLDSLRCFVPEFLHFPTIINSPTEMKAHEQEFLSQLRMQLMERGLDSNEINAVLTCVNKENAAHDRSTKAKGLNVQLT